MVVCRLRLSYSLVCLLLGVDWGLTVLFCLCLGRVDVETYGRVNWVYRGRLIRGLVVLYRAEVVDWELTMPGLYRIDFASWIR